MTTTIRLTVLTGPHEGTRYCMRGLDAALVGRAAECQIRFCGEKRDLCISRYHCQLLPDSAGVHVQDMDSANGTYINGHRVGGTAQPSDLAPFAPLAAVAEDGDILTIGGTSLRVNIMNCGVDFPEDGSVKKDCPVAC